MLLKIFCQTYISNVLHTDRTVQLRGMNKWATGQRNTWKTEWGQLVLKPWSSVCIGRFFFLKAIQRQRVKKKVAGRSLEAHWPTCEGLSFLRIGLLIRVLSTHCGDVVCRDQFFWRHSNSDALRTIKRSLKTWWATKRHTRTAKAPRGGGQRAIC